MFLLSVHPSRIIQASGPRSGTGTPLSCEKYREDLIGVLGSTATPEAAEAVSKHFDTCEAYRAKIQQYRALRARLEASAGAAAPPALENQVMACVPTTSPGGRPPQGLDGLVNGTPAIRHGGRHSEEPPRPGSQEGDCRVRLDNVSRHA